MHDICSYITAKGTPNLMKLYLKNAIITVAAFLLCFVAHAQYDLDVFFFRGRQSLADGKYAGAIENFNVLSRLDTTDYWNFFYRGIAKYNLGDLRGAKKDFSTSVRINPVFTSGYHYLAITESRFGNYDKALSYLEKALNLRPGFEGLYFSRGVTYFLSQQFDKAVADFNKYIRKQPEDPSAYLNRGASYLFLGDTLKALNDYNKAIELDNSEPEGYVRRGRLYAASKKYDKAIKDLDKAISLDSTAVFAYFNRAIMYYEQKNYNAAMADLNKVLVQEPGNALTLYNRSLINAQIGNFEDALSDMDRVININPKNVLAYYNRASYFISMKRWQDALEDYDKAIELYPDFAKAYMNRSYVNSMLGKVAASKKDYETAKQKVKEYRLATANASNSFADTTKKYSSLLALDADFAKKDFNDELLRHRDIDIRLKPLYKFSLSEKYPDVNYALKNRYENVLLDKFIADSPVPINITNADSSFVVNLQQISKLSDVGADSKLDKPLLYFLKGLYDMHEKRFNSSLSNYDKAVDTVSNNKYGALYKSFYMMNRGVLRAEMIEFINSIENNVQTLKMDDKGAIRARVRDRTDQTYDYSEAIGDMRAASDVLPDNPYINYNLGNLLCLSSKPVEAIEYYSKAIDLYGFFGDAYYNRGLVLIYLNDKEKGCIDLSYAGELGVKDAYVVIKKYCEDKLQGKE